MNFQCQVNCINNEIKKVILDIAIANNWRNIYSIQNFPNCTNLIFLNDGVISGTMYSDNMYGPEISIEEALRLVSKPREVPIMIEKYPVKFTTEGISVGCTTVSKETVKKIYDKLFPQDVVVGQAMMASNFAPGEIGMFDDDEDDDDDFYEEDEDDDYVDNEDEKDW